MVVLFLPLSKGNLLEMLPIATSIPNAVFCLDKKVAPLQTLIGDIPAIASDGSPLEINQTPKVESRNPATPKSTLHRFLPSLAKGFLQMRSECRRAKKLLEKHKDISLIVVSGDRSIGIETAVIAQANKNNIPSLIVPFAMSFREAAAEPRLRSGKRGGQYAVSNPLRYLLRFIFPSWIFVYKNTPLFFQPPYTALAAKLLGIMPKAPWIIGGGAATKMAVESEALRNQLLEQGMSADKMIVTGKPSLDDIAAQLTTENTHTEKVILCSVPNFGEHDLLPWDKHKEEMQFLFKTLAATKAKVILNLHPRSDRSWYQPLADEAGLQISDERIYALLPKADIVISSYSSVIAQAVAMAKPSVVIDFYGFDYPVYDGAPGTEIVKDKKKLLPHFELLLHDDTYYSSCVSEQKQRGSEWALLDGKSTERIVSLITELTA